VKIDRALVDKAVAKKLFARALKTDVKAAADLGETVEKLLMQQLMQMMNMARKAGAVHQRLLESGCRRQEWRCHRGVPCDGRRSRRREENRPGPQGLASRNGMTEEEIPSYHLFSESEMEGLMGQNAFIHAAVLAGQAGEGVVKRAKMLEQYRNGGQSRAAGGAGRQKQ
jgi:hypothetical protein